MLYQKHDCQDKQDRQQNNRSNVSYSCLHLEMPLTCSR